MGLKLKPSPNFRCYTSHSWSPAYTYLLQLNKYIALFTSCARLIESWYWMLENSLPQFWPYVFQLAYDNCTITHLFLFALKIIFHCPMACSPWYYSCQFFIYPEMCCHFSLLHTISDSHPSNVPLPNQGHLGILLIIINY